MAGAVPAWADDVVLDPTSFDCLGADCAQSSVHEDADPFKGWVSLTATNNGTESWGDFHFAFFQVGTEAIDNVHWMNSGSYQPTMAINGNPVALGSVAVDNVTVGATLDLYFYGNPVGPGDSVTFNVYSNNQDNVSFFGTLYYPTPIPEPGTAVMMGLSLLGLLAAGRRRASR